MWTSDKSICMSLIFPSSLSWYLTAALSGSSLCMRLQLVSHPIRRCPHHRKHGQTVHKMARYWELFPNFGALHPSRPTSITRRKHKHAHKKKQITNDVAINTNGSPLLSGEIVQMQGHADESINQWHHNVPPLRGRFRALPACGTTSAQSASTAAGMDIPTRGCQLSEGGLTSNKSIFEGERAPNRSTAPLSSSLHHSFPVQAFSTAAARLEQQRQPS